MSRSRPPADLDARSSRRRFLRLAGGAGATGAAVAGTALTGLATAPPAGASTTDAVERGYAETVAPVSTTSSTAVPNLVLVVPVGDVPVAVEYGAYVVSSKASGLVKLYLLRDGEPVHEVGATVAGAGGLAQLHGLVRIPAGSPGDATFSVLLTSWTPGARASVVASPLSPAFIQARRL